MDFMITASGLVALLIAYAAVRESGGWSGTTGPMQWSFSGSWASSIAAVLAIIVTLLGIDPTRGLALGLGVTMILTPFIYRGLGNGAASKPVFFIATALMAWATLSILYIAAVAVPDLVESLPLLAGLVIDVALILALIGAVLHVARSLAAAVSTDGSEAWTLP